MSSTEMQFEPSDTSRVLQDDESRKHLSTTQLSRASPRIFSVDWRRYFNFSPSMRSSSGALAVTPQSPHYPPRPLSTTSGRIQSSPRAFPHDKIGRASPRQQSSQTMISQRIDGRDFLLTFDSSKSEGIMLPLQLLNSSHIELARTDWCICGTRLIGVSHAIIFAARFTVIGSRWRWKN